MGRKHWTEGEDFYIQNHFGKETYTAMANHLHCSTTAIKNRAQSLGFSVETRKIKRWTEEEIILLQELAPKYLNKTIAKKLDRPTYELNKKARELGIPLIFKRPVWTAKKIKYLQENINKKPITKIEEELDVNYYQIIDQLEELNIPYQSNRWTNEEIELLLALAPKVYIRSLASVLNRSEGAIITKANKMGIEHITLNKNWTMEELNYIRNNWKKISIADMARYLQVSTSMVQRQADFMNLPKLGKNPYKKWKNSKIEKLETLASNMTISELAKKFRTTNTAITSVANKYGIKLMDEKIHWTEEDNKELEKLAPTMDLNNLAKTMNRSTSAIRLQAERLGISILSHPSVWTDENTQELLKLAAEGKTKVEIAILMDKKDITIAKKAKEFNIILSVDDPKPWEDWEVDELIELSKTYTLSELVKHFKRSSSSIKGCAKKENILIIPDRKGWSPEEMKQLEELVMAAKKTTLEIANILGRTEDAVVIKINRMGLQIQTNDKRHWTEEEEILLKDLWGNFSLETLAKKLKRSVSSVHDKAFQLGLGSYLNSNYEGLTIKEICELFNLDYKTVSIGWVGLGLKVKHQKVSNAKRYRYVEIQDLYAFLEKNQNIWDSRQLDKNILGEEPTWLVEKRKRDSLKDYSAKRLSMTKQQLILAKKFFVELDKILPHNEKPVEEENSIQKVKK